MLEECLAAAAGVGSYDDALALTGEAGRAALARQWARCKPFWRHAITEHLDKSIYHDQLKRLALVFPTF